MQIALDAMGGDLGPQELISGALLAVERDDLSILLVGDEQVLSDHLQSSSASKSLRDRLAIVHADTVVEMEENPVDAIRKKKDSSIMSSWLKSWLHNTPFLTSNSKELMTRNY